MKVSSSKEVVGVNSQMALLNTSSSFQVSLIILFHSMIKIFHYVLVFNFREIVWPERLSKSGTMQNQSEGQMLLDIVDDYGLGSNHTLPFL